MASTPQFYNPPSPRDPNAEIGLFLRSNVETTSHYSTGLHNPRDVTSTKYSSTKL